MLAKKENERGRKQIWDDSKKALHLWLVFKKAHEDSNISKKSKKGVFYSEDSLVLLDLTYPQRGFLRRGLVWLIERIPIYYGTCDLNG